MKPVESSTIEAIGYDPETRQMKVRFKSGGTYSYDGVPAHEHAKLMGAESHGSHFHKHIKSKYKANKLEV